MTSAPTRTLDLEDHDHDVRTASQPTPAALPPKKVRSFPISSRINADSSDSGWCHSGVRLSQRLSIQTGCNRCHSRKASHRSSKRAAFNIDGMFWRLPSWAGVLVVVVTRVPPQRKRHRERPGAQGEVAAPQRHRPAVFRHAGGVGIQREAVAQAAVRGHPGIIHD